MHVHTCMSSRPKNTSRFDEKPHTFNPVLIPDHSPVAVLIIVTFLSTVEQSYVRRSVKGSVVIAATVIVTTGGPNLALEIAKAQWLTFDDESWKQQTGEDCDGKRSYLHLID